MRQHEAIQYLPARGLSPLMEVECATAHCSRRFTLAHAVAFPAVYTDGSLRMGFWCSEVCYLSVVPTQYCGSC